MTIIPVRKLFFISYSGQLLTNTVIREHSILCLRSLLQGNPENQKIVEELNAKEVVPSEVLDKHGYEPFIDDNGRVKLRKTDEVRA
jgi:palmitoyltransferase